MGDQIRQERAKQGTALMESKMKELAELDLKFKKTNEQINSLEELKNQAEKKKEQLKERSSTFGLTSIGHVSRKNGFLE